MKPSELPIVGEISNTNKDFYGKYSDLSGKNILCIGFSQEELDLYVYKYQPSKVTVLTKWADHVDAEIKNCEFIIGDITEKTPFRDGQFDAILSLSVLEHLTPLQSAFHEMSRIVRNGGEMLHMFGPSWSCAYGHHIYANPNIALLNFSLWQMPAHIHLLCSRDEIKTHYLKSGLSEKDVTSVYHWFFETDIINRVFFDDYMKTIQEANLQINEMEFMHNRLPLEHIKILRSKYPGYMDFSTYGFKAKFFNNKYS
jgi:SAM-dependent methyltransferase